MNEFKVGDQLEAFHQGRFVYGKILELDLHPLDSSYALILVDSPALPAPELWVNLRLAKRLAR